MNLFRTQTLNIPCDHAYIFPWPFRSCRFDTGSRRLVEGELEDHGSMHNLPYINGDSERRVNMSLVGGQCLGFNIRGGSEYGVGIFVSKYVYNEVLTELGI